MFTLFDACGQYVEYCNTLEGVKTANVKVYELSFRYAYNGQITEKEYNFLVNYFNLY